MWVNPANAVYTNQALLVAGNCTASATTATATTLSASAASGGSGSITSTYQQSSNGSTWSDLASGNVTGLTAARTYYFRIKCVDQSLPSGQTAYSASITVTTTAGTYASTSSGVFKKRKDPVSTSAGVFRAPR